MIILDKIKDINEEIDISKREVEKFHLLMKTVISEESLDNTDSIVSDTILKIVLKISELLKNNIDSLKIPEIFKIALKKIKSAEHTGESDKASETSKDGSEEDREQESQK